MQDYFTPLFTQLEQSQGVKDEVKEEDDPSEASEAGLVGSNVAFESSKHDESN